MGRQGRPNPWNQPIPMLQAASPASESFFSFSSSPSPTRTPAPFFCAIFVRTLQFVSNLFGQGLSSLPCSSFLLLFAPLASLKLRAAGFRKGKANSSCRLLGIESAWKGWASFGILEHLHGWALRAQHCQSMCKSWAEESAYSRGEREKKIRKGKSFLCVILMFGLPSLSWVCIILLSARAGQGLNFSPVPVFRCWSLFFFHLLWHL